MLNQMIILVGPSGSGKTTFARSYIRKRVGWIRISRDDKRKMLFGYTDLDLNKYYASSQLPENENHVSQSVYDDILLAYELRKNVILDNTHLRLSYILDIMDEFDGLFDFSIITFDAKKEDCLIRDAQREAKVGQAVIETQFIMFNQLKGHPEFKVLQEEYKF